MWLWSLLLCVDGAVAQAPVSDGPPPDARVRPMDDAQLDEARALFENGRRLYAEGAYEPAIEAWQACYDMTERVELLFNLSNAHERLGRLSEALDLLNRYRAMATLSPEEQDQLARRATGLIIRIDEAAAELRDVGRGQRMAGTATAWGGAAAMVLGAVLGGSALAARSDVRATCLNTPDGFLCPTDGMSAVQRAERDGSWSVVALAAGSVGLVSGVVLTVRAPARRSPNVEVSWRF
ncbi:MAG: tetratricopeptide repeat protein [Myxococcales bacterium]|nr:tetratricopeptide repeat protein [Myxococcales bacterium]